MSSTNSSSTNTDGPGRPQQSTPPLLPAFLITGLLLAAIVFIIVWRHLIERRALQFNEEDPTWPSEDFGSGGTKLPTPKLWELQFSSHNARTTWADIMPLSAAPLRVKGKPRLPRYLVPSDRPVTFLTRTFGGDRREPRPPPPPPISVLARTQSPRELLADEDEDDEPIERLQVAVLIALPHPHCGRRVSYSPDKKETSLETIAECSDTEEPEPRLSPDKGKKRSLEMPEYVTKGGFDDEDEEGPLEVAFGTATLPFAASGDFGKVS